MEWIKMLLTYHKDSYMAHRNELKFGYEGRYRRTISPTAPANRNILISSSTPSPSQSPPSLKSSSSTGHLQEASLSSTGWERHYNVRQPSTTVVFTSEELKAFKEKEKRAKDSQKDNQKEGPDRITLHPTPVVPKRGLTLDLHSSFSTPSLRSLSTTSSSRSPSRLSTASQESDKSAPSRLVSPWRTSLDSLDTPVHTYRSPILDKNYSKFSYYKKLNSDKLCASEVSSARSSSISGLSTLSSCSPDLQDKSVPVPKTTECSNALSSSDTSTNCDTTVCTSSPPPRPPVISVTSDDEEERPGNGLVLKYGREKLKEEIECEKLSRTLVNQLAVTDLRLQSLLVPGPDLKTTADYMDGIFELHIDGTTLQRRSTISSTDGSTHPRRRMASPKERRRNNGKIEKSGDPAPLPADSAYFTTSESKAKFLTRYKDAPTDMDGVNTTKELKRRKEELVKSISRKLDILRAEQLTVGEERRVNEELGREVAARVEKMARPNEVDKFRLHVGEIDKITSLVLGLSGRLARAENALMILPDNTAPEERKILQGKRDKLSEQLEEAKQLKTNIDRRSEQVSKFLLTYLSFEEFQDYDHFIKMKAKLIMDAREIDDKIRLGEEQLAALREVLDVS